MNVKWLVEDFAADNKIWKLIAELKSRNQPLEIIDYFNFYLHGKVKTEDGLIVNSAYSDNDCVVVQASIQLALWIKRNKPWVPGVWLDPEKFKCTTYYSYLGEHLFNQNYEFTTIAEFKRCHERFYAMHGVQDCLFIRPDSGLKSFSGQVFYKEKHVRDWQFIDMSTKPEDIIVVAKPQVINSEYRFVIAKGEPIAASMYQQAGKPSQLHGAPRQAFAKAKEIASIIDRDLHVGPMYMIDLAGGPLDFKLLEINCFNCSGMYECNKKVIVDAANEIAWAEHQEYHKETKLPENIASTYGK